MSAGLVSAPEHWRWSSAAAYLKGRRDGLTDTAPMFSRFPDMKAMLKGGLPEGVEGIVRDDETIGRPRGDAAFLAKLERKTGRHLVPGKRGPKPREGN